MNLLENLKTSSTPFLVVRDFNIHFDDRTSAQTQEFIELLDSFHLEQYVSCPTHIRGHTLDLVIAPANLPNLLFTKSYAKDLISDHFAVEFNVCFEAPVPSEHATMQVRKIKNMDVSLLKQDILASELVLNPADDLDTFVVQYNTCLRSLLDKHAPLETIKVKPKKTPWYTPRNPHTSTT